VWSELLLAVATALAFIARIRANTPSRNAAIKEDGRTLNWDRKRHNCY
jgi:hypothetical protein